MGSCIRPRVRILRSLPLPVFFICGSLRASQHSPRLPILDHCSVSKTFYSMSMPTSGLATEWRRADSSFLRLAPDWKCGRDNELRTGSIPRGSHLSKNRQCPAYFAENSLISTADSRRCLRTGTKKLQLERPYYYPNSNGLRAHSLLSHFRDALPSTEFDLYRRPGSAIHLVVPLPGCHRNHGPHETLSRRVNRND
ncbi:hypothetical protein PMAYCL1PPCAC_16111, partial [Pristionchus mayeri]